MSNFYIGQRVRITASMHCPELVGLEATVTSWLHRVENFIYGEEWDGHDITVDGVGDCSMSDGIFGFLCWKPENMEPVTPHGLESIEDINALYEPSPNEVLANTGMRMEWQR